MAQRSITSELILRQCAYVYYGMTGLNLVRNAPCPTGAYAILDVQKLICGPPCAKVRHGNEHTFVEQLASGALLADQEEWQATEQIDEHGTGQSTARPRFEVVQRNAADAYSRTVPTYAPRLVELRRVPG